MDRGENDHQTNEISDALLHRPRPQKEEPAQFTHSMKLKSSKLKVRRPIFTWNDSLKYNM